MTWFYKEREEGAGDIINIIPSLAGVAEVLCFTAAIGKVTFQERNSPVSHTGWRV